MVAKLDAPAVASSAQIGSKIIVYAGISVAWPAQFHPFAILWGGREVSCDVILANMQSVWPEGTSHTH